MLSNTKALLVKIESVKNVINILKQYCADRKTSDCSVIEPKLEPVEKEIDKITSDLESYSVRILELMKTMFTEQLILSLKDIEDPDIYLRITFLVKELKYL